MATFSTTMKNDWDTMSMEELKKKYELMNTKLEARRATCRKSSKQYYDKTFKLSDNATAQQVAKNKLTLEKRDAYQKAYYEKNKAKIKEKQKEYRQKKARAKKEQKEKEQKEHEQKELEIGMKMIKEQKEKEQLQEAIGIKCGLIPPTQHPNVVKYGHNLL